MTTGNRQVSYAEFLAHVNRFKVRDVLIRCNAMANWADGIPAGEAFVETRVAGGGVLRTIVAPSALAFVAKTSLLRSSDNRQRELTDREFSLLLAMQGELEDPFVKEDADLEGFLIRTAWEQFPLQEMKNRMIPRTLMLLRDANDALGRTPIDIEAAWEKMTGLSLEQFLIIGFAYLTGVGKSNRVVRHYASRGIFEGKVAVEQCEAFLGLASATYEEFRELSSAFRIDDPLYSKTEFNVLAQRPLIAVRDELIAPVPRLLLRRITDGVRYDLRDRFREEKGNPFSEYFGKLFEHYTGELLKWAFGEDKVFPEPVYGKEHRRGPDWVVIDDGTALLFECRSSGLLLESKTAAGQKQIRGDLKRILIETAKKYPQKVDDLRDGSAGVDVTSVTNFVPVIITYESAYFEPVLRSLAIRELDQRAQEYRHIDITDLETVTSWHGRYPISRLLEEWRATYKANPREFGRFLHDWAKKYGLNLRNELLDQRMGRFTEEYLGSAYPPQASSSQRDTLGW